MIEVAEGYSLSKESRVVAIPHTCCAKLPSKLMKINTIKSKFEKDYAQTIQNPAAGSYLDDFHQHMHSK